MSKINTMMERLHNPDLGIFLVRVASAMVFIYAGWAKIQHIDMVAGFFSSLGIPVFLTYFVAYAELLGGIAIALGIFVRYFGIIHAVIMLVAICKVHFSNGFNPQAGGYEYVLVMLLASLAMVFLGSGKYTISRIYKK